MFQLHDRTRRRITLAIFFAFGLAPTVAVWSWAVWWRSASYVRLEEDRLGLLLTLRVTISAVQHPRPGAVLYRGVELSDPETGQPVFGCDAVEARRDWLPLGTAQPSLELFVSQPKILASSWDEIWRLMDRVLSRRIDLDGRGLQVTAEQLTFYAGGQPWIKLADLKGRVDATAERAHAEVEFHLAEDRPGEPARLQVTRDRRVKPAAVQLEFFSGSTPMPCSLLAVGLAGFGACGPDARFDGYFQAVASRSGPDGELKGQFTDVDLAQLVNDPLPQQLRGSGNLRIETARFHNGRLQEVKGEVAAGSGAISRTLVEVAVDRLGLTPGSGGDFRQRMIPFDKLATRFVCDAKGLRLVGLASNDSPATIIAGRQGPILSESPSPSTPQPLAAVVQALFLDTDDRLPVARKSDRILSHLPADETRRSADGAIMRE
jgi:hypothetical protein